MFRTAQSTVLKAIKDRLNRTKLSPRAKRSLGKSLKIDIRISGTLIIKTKHPALIHVIKGRKKAPMMWLKKTPPLVIPVITREGKMIFRTATARSFQAAGGGPNEGRPGWIYPGKPKNTFLALAKRDASKLLKEKFRTAMSQAIRKTYGKKKKL